jgi:hypothetical protein
MRRFPRKTKSTNPLEFSFIPKELKDELKYYRKKGIAVKLRPNSGSIRRKIDYESLYFYEELNKSE